MKKLTQLKFIHDSLKLSMDFQKLRKFEKNETRLKMHLFIEIKIRLDFLKMKFIMIFDIKNLIYDVNLQHWHEWRYNGRKEFEEVAEMGL